MYHKVPHENFFHKGLRAVNSGMKIYGAAKDIYTIGSAAVAGLRGAYSIAAPMMALL